MDQLFKLGLLLLLLTRIGNAFTHKSFDQCETIVKNWKSSSLSDVREDKHVLKHLLFFLHVPRTGGRTYYHCFLRKLYPSSLVCPRSYDKFRFNRSKTDCRLLTSHDDYSVMSKLPSDRTSVVTLLRNPIDRFFSSYEFSIEVAARYMIYPNISSATKMSKLASKKSKAVTTMDIWPWKYLVPWMRDDLFARKEARKHKSLSYSQISDLYNAEDIVMPLIEYMRHPIALDIIHNGATFQVAGLTNNSNLREAHELRQCVIKYQRLGDHVLEVAKKRLDDMLYVGLTESHNESALLFANLVGAQVISQLVELNLSTELASNNEPAQNVSTVPDSKVYTSLHQKISLHLKEVEVPFVDNAPKTNESMTVEGLHEAFKKCVPELRRVQTNRRNTSFHKIPSLNFRKEARLRVPESILREIASLNSLDVQLFKHAQYIFANQHKHMAQKVDIQKSNSRYFLDAPSWRTLSLDAPSWRTLSLTTVGMLLIFIFLLVGARRTKLKLKL
ncbi:protein-tyrosine sulfotransferase-like isoform X1 [Daucus carota subsp. sativus]|uniref:protein-tyrosine sulfotransferase-like isoform X1 n=1 Tax=Daucus carota subsp. sativus TaxID=79200 RepID=UPI0007F03117|nr:PREDICTED: protein-tyrosine sulfotransferase-like isoform X1 [Daucus carota subsp. sativus]